MWTEIYFFAFHDFEIISIQFGYTLKVLKSGSAASFTKSGVFQFKNNAFLDFGANGLMSTWNNLKLHIVSSGPCVSYIQINIGFCHLIHHAELSSTK